MLYWVVVEEVPSKKDVDENGTLPKIVLQPTCVEARDDKDAAFKVALASDVVKAMDPNKIQVVVRPF